MLKVLPLLFGKNQIGHPLLGGTIPVHLGKILRRRGRVRSGRNGDNVMLLLPRLALTKFRIQQKLKTDTDKNSKVSLMRVIKLRAVLPLPLQSEEPISLILSPDL